ncbi:MAG: Nif3-like dinuclear metal center hexameric protein [Phycisphaerae bacterium]|nr:Nif3-like dinuclear metal center hexameric protein [Phycisphaerae bacterium]
MKVKNLAKIIDSIAPPQLALDWDNVGLLVGDSEKPIKTVLLTIDITKDVLAEAAKLNTDMILSYHPVIWDGLKTVTSTGPGSIVYQLIRSNTPVYSIHTALDIAKDGVNDALAKMLGLKDPEPIGDYVQPKNADNYKLITFVPPESLKTLTNALFKAGAGAIGNYSRCGFTSEGTGSFLPLKGAKPAIGKVGKIEKLNEIKFESIVPAAKLDNVLAELLKNHPYETPAHDVIKLHRDPQKFGLGRIGNLKEPMTIEQIIKIVKKHTGTKAFGMVGPEKRTVKKAAVCAGSCGKIINSVIAQKTDLYLTGELKHHHAIAAREANLTCICLSHTVSERFMLKILAKRLQKLANTITFKVSKKDSDPFNWKNI